VDIFGPDTYPGLLGRIICHINKIKKRGFKNDYELRISTELKDWLKAKPWQQAAEREKTAEMLWGDLKILKEFITELYGKEEAGKIFPTLYGAY
jgi:hypothetical protein